MLARRCKWPGTRVQTDCQFACCEIARFRVVTGCRRVPCQTARSAPRHPTAMGVQASAVVRSQGTACIAAGSRGGAGMDSPKNRRQQHTPPPSGSHDGAGGDDKKSHAVTPSGPHGVRVSASTNHRGVARSTQRVASGHTTATVAACGCTSPLTGLGKRGSTLWSFDVSRGGTKKIPSDFFPPSSWPGAKALLTTDLGIGALLCHRVTARLLYRPPVHALGLSVERRTQHHVPPCAHTESVAQCKRLRHRPKRWVPSPRDTSGRERLGAQVFARCVCGT